MSQTRAHARRHVIANWRGLAFHCFDIDRHLTGLQGQNGSGKTTVMAAYVTAILPNQRLLNFPNITAGGASGKTDAGLWGRLGDNGVSYTLIEWVTPKGKSIWAGVAMTRHNMPSIEMKTFTVEDLPEVVDPYDAFLIKEGSHTTVPQLGRLRDHLTMLGARVTTHRSVADYLRTLYENGITPLPMSTHEEQERFYRILATSMAGSSLGSLARSGLRDYLLTEDSSLERRVSNMRESLEQCRQTKRELERAQDSHAEINGIYESAWKMSSCAFFGALGRYEQASESWRTQLKITRETRRDHTTKKNELERLDKTVVELKKKIAEAQELVTEKNREWNNKSEARQLRINLEKARSDHHIAQSNYESFKIKRDEAQRYERLAEAEHQMRQEEYIRIAGEMGNLQEATEALINRVTALKVAREKLAAAQKAISDQQIDQYNASVVKKKLDDEYNKLTAKETHAQSEFDSLQEHQANFERLLEDIQKLSQLEDGRSLAAEDAYAYGLQLDAILRDKVAESQQIDSLSSALAKANDLASQQQQVQKQAQALGIDSSPMLVDTISSIQNDIERLENEEIRRKSDLQEKRKNLSQIEARIPSLEDAHRRYSQAESYRQQLCELEPEMASIASVNELETAQAATREQATTLQNRRIAIENINLKTAERIQNLRSPAGTMNPLIGALAEQFEGRLFAANFDELSAEEAATTQARIGIWAEAIVVESPQYAAQRASYMEDRPDTLLFISEKAATLQQNALTIGDSELIKENTEDAAEKVRLTRRPAHPVLGRRAREAEIIRLDSELNMSEQMLVQLREKSRKIDLIATLTSNLLALGPGAWEENPQPALEAEHARKRSLEISISQINSSISQIGLDIDEAFKKKRKYTSLEPNKNLIDPPQHKDEANRLEGKFIAARKAKNWLDRHAQAVESILRNLPILAKVPDESKRKSLEIQIDQLKKSRSILSFQRDALTHLIAVINDFQYIEDEKVYENKSSVLKSLKSQLEPAKERQESAQERYKTTRMALNEIQGQVNTHEAVFRQAELEKSRLTQVFDATGLIGSDEECQLAQKALEKATTAANEIQNEHLTHISKRAKAATLLEASEKELFAKNIQTSEKLSSLRQERHAKNELDRAAAVQQLRGKIDTLANRQQFFPTGNLINAFQESLVQTHLLLDRLKAYPDVKAEVSAISKLYETTEERRAIQTLKVWERVHRHIEQRIPRNIATSDDPKTALGQMHEKMQELRRTLDAQENEMRVRSSGVSNAIRSRLRTAGFLINRLNLELEQVSFGSIRGVRIMKEEPQHMSEMLKALQDDGNRSIFDTETPLEEALAKMYERIGGGRTVGSKLLDYRNYITLRLEIKRINGKWDVTDGVSTGEAIGVGAAILVMILRTWNTEAKRISGAAAGQSMQQILLDEANRLDPDALDTFTEFCERMDVQALVAAPGLERPRRSTVFLLERGMVNNREQVTIRGQRITA